MKKSIIGLAAFAFIALSLVTSCNSSEKKVDEAKIEVMEAKVDLKEAKEEYLIDVENYKKETAEKIAENDKKIAEFKTQIAFKRKEFKDDYQKQVDKLEKKNNDMQKKLDDYKVEGKENWETFKTEAIDFSTPFLWFDNYLLEEEKGILKQKNCFDSWICVDLKKDEDQLKKYIK